MKGKIPPHHSSFHVRAPELALTFVQTRGALSLQGGLERGPASSQGPGAGGSDLQRGRPRLCSVNGSTHVVTSSGGNMLGE